MVCPGGNAVQVVLGPIVDQVAGEIRSSLACKAAPHSSEGSSAPAVLKALGDRVETVEARSSRLLVQLPKGAEIDAQALLATGVRAVARGKDGLLHLIVGPEADRLAVALLKLN